MKLESKDNEIDNKTQKLCAITSYPINPKRKHIEPDKLDCKEKGKALNTKYIKLSIWINYSCNI